MEKRLIRTRTLPYAVDRLCAVSQKAAELTLVSLASHGKVCLVGDDVSLPEEEGAVERSLSQKEDTRLSLFENVFGRSAFKNLEEPAEPADTELDDERFGAAIDLRLLDGPSYLLPPISSLYGSLMEGLLVKPREAPSTEEDGMEVDVEAEVEEKEVEDIIPGDRRLRPRVVDAGEMDMLVELFTEHAVIGERTYFLIQCLGMLISAKQLPRRKLSPS